MGSLNTIPGGLSPFQLPQPSLVLVGVAICRMPRTNLQCDFCLFIVMAFFMRKARAARRQPFCELQKQAVAFTNQNPRPKPSGPYGGCNEMHHETTSHKLGELLVYKTCHWLDPPFFSFLLLFLLFIDPPPRKLFWLHKPQGNPKLACPKWQHGRIPAVHILVASKKKGWGP